MAQGNMSLQRATTCAGAPSALTFTDEALPTLVSEFSGGEVKTGLDRRFTWQTLHRSG